MALLATFCAALSADAADLDLAAALERVAVHGRAVRQARLAVDEARSAEVEARRLRLPTLALTQSVTEIDPETEARANAAADGLGDAFGIDIPPFVYGRSFRTEAQTQWSVWTAGRLSSGIRVAESLRAATFADELSTLRQSRVGVIRGYFGLAAADGVIVARESALRRAERRLQESRNRLDVGLGTRQEVLRWRVEVEGATADLASARADRFVARLELAEGLALPISRVESVVMPTPFHVDALLDWADAVDAERAVETATFNDLPEIEAAEARIRAAEEQRRRNRAELYPRLDASAAAGWLENDTLSPDEFSTWSAALVLTVPIDARGDQRARVRQAEARLEAAGVGREIAESQLRLELGRALAELMRSRTRLRSARVALDEAEARRTLLARQHEVGLVALLDLIDADNVAAGAEVALAQARAGFLAAVAELELVWEAADPPGGGLVP
jgi:outer membrane protein